MKTYNTHVPRTYSKGGNREERRKGNREEKKEEERRKKERLREKRVHTYRYSMQLAMIYMHVYIGPLHHFVSNNMNTYICIHNEAN